MHQFSAAKCASQLARSLWETLEKLILDRLDLDCKDDTFGFRT